MAQDWFSSRQEALLAKSVSQLSPGDFRKLPSGLVLKSLALVKGVPYGSHWCVQGECALCTHLSVQTCS